jgi:hypothetical protein
MATRAWHLISDGSSYRNAGLVRSGAGSSFGIGAGAPRSRLSAKRIPSLTPATISHPAMVSRRPTSLMPNTTWPTSDLPATGLSGECVIGTYISQE